MSGVLEITGSSVNDVVVILSLAATLLALTVGDSLIMVLIDCTVLGGLLTFSWMASVVTLSLDDTAGTALELVCLELFDSISTR